MTGGNTMATTGRKRSKPRDLTSPRGQLGAFVEAWIDKNYAGDKQRLADAMGVSLSAVQKWCTGSSAPDLVDLDRLAKLIGLGDWSKLAAAAVRHSANRK